MDQILPRFSRNFLVAGLLLTAGILSANPVLAAPAGEGRVKFTKASPNSAYGEYLVGKYAVSRGDTMVAAESLISAAKADPLNESLREKAFIAALLSGDIDYAVSARPTNSESPRYIQALGDLVVAVDYIKANKPAKAGEALDEMLALQSQNRTGSLLRPWVYALDGKWDQALSGAPQSRDRLLSLFGALDQAVLSEIRGKTDEAEALYKELYQPGAVGVFFGPSYGAFLERRGRKDEALKIYQDIAAMSPDVLTEQSIIRIQSGSSDKPPLPSLKQGIADTLFMSATLYLTEQQVEMALTSLRLSLYLNPDQDRAKILLGQIHGKMRDFNSAQKVWADIEPNSPFYREARMRLAWSLNDHNQKDQAFEILANLSKVDPQNLDLTVQMADILRAQSKYQSGLDLIRDRVKTYGDSDFTWQAWFMQAVLYDQLGQWDMAESAVKKAKALAPDRPEVLNFLGYGWIERNMHVKDGMELVRKALEADPKSGAMMDSLGWGYYRLGEYDQALDWIEQAILLEPSDPEVNEHLGDVYRALGRGDEARYQWQRVLTLEGASEKQLASVKQKLGDTEVKAKSTVASVDAPAPAKVVTSKP
ncbi:tetratricopeptide repeat protein [Asticcacaulis sp. SL142]|uniref:tetratricopeptide repeat protein n=1 Tax=Asticcacaulis sp. SL142 TaxID=2995155 RepID=UPI00226CCA6B|nr:tetratricopeptide repeat protein [Asticcacaulis sp. SL142]WAC49036.1 tetratricopeptide repeat protein [Asticcacaulis sp. SL142]